MCELTAKIGRLIRSMMMEVRHRAGRGPLQGREPPTVWGERNRLCVVWSSACICVPICRTQKPFSNDDTLCVWREHPAQTRPGSPRRV